MRLIRARQSGFAVTEALVALALALLVGTLVCAALIGQMRLARMVTSRAAANDALRTVLHILPAELALAVPADVRAASPDSVSSRWVRASGVICRSSATHIWIRLYGMRAPDPAKDSMLLVGPVGERALPVTSLVTDATACHAPPRAQVFRLPLPGGLDRGGAVLIFEPGTYYLSQRALRYRLGGEGRQPITDELFAAGTALSIDAAAGFASLSLQLLGAPVDTVLRTASFRFGLANMAAQ